MLYMLAVSGVMIHMHYCGKQLASWNVYLKTTGCGGDCGDESAPEHNCCKDKVVSAKVSGDHSVSLFKYKPPIADAFLLPDPLPSFHSRSSAFLPAPDHEVCRANAPPGTWQEIPLYKLHSRFTYYG